MANGNVSGLVARTLISSAVVKVADTRARVLVNYPAQEGWVSGVTARSIYNAPVRESVVTGLTSRVITAGETAEGRLTQVRARVLFRGHIDDPKIRVWTYTQDGHDFYVVRLGEEETLVYDTHSDLWYKWASTNSDIWKANTGINWLGGTSYAASYGSNVIVGDHTNGALYFLDPTYEREDNSQQGSELTSPFERVFQAQIQKRGYDRERTYSVELEGSTGEFSAEDLGGITLYLSDDQGNSYKNAGTVTVNPGSYDSRVTWRSLGSFPSPGRLFKFVDYGIFDRIDFASMESDRPDG